MTERQQLAALLDWYVAMGIDEAIGETSRDSFAPSAPRSTSAAAPSLTPRPTPAITLPSLGAPANVRPIVPASNEIAGARKLTQAARKPNIANMVKRRAEIAGMWARVRSSIISTREAR